jgi:hypothetical protein
MQASNALQPGHTGEVPVLSGRLENPRVAFIISDFGRFDNIG